MSDRVLEFPSRPGGVDGELVASVEAMLFASGSPLRAGVMAVLLGCETAEVRTALQVLQQRREGGGVELVKVNSGWQLRTAVRFSPLIAELLGAKPMKLSQAALETLAIVAWQQPATKSDVEDLRGVDSGGVIKSLVDKGFLRTAGRRSEPGRPLLYRTTGAFLELFELADLKDLPTLRERAALERDKRAGDEEGPTE